MIQTKIEIYKATGCPIVRTWLVAHCVDVQWVERNMGW